MLAWLASPAVVMERHGFVVKGICTRCIQSMNKTDFLLSVLMDYLGAAYYETIRH